MLLSRARIDQSGPREISSKRAPDAQAPRNGNDSITVCDSSEASAAHGSVLTIPVQTTFP